jgi:hypothetical protein
MTTVYLAWNEGCDITFRNHADTPADILVAFPELDKFLKRKENYNVGRWVLDSGAFSAWKSGTPIVLDDFIAACRDVDADEIFGLDVINDYKATKRNLEKMWAADVPAIPTYHQGSPWTELQWCKKNSPTGKIAISPKGRKVKTFMDKCFARTWPCKIHGFGMCSEKRILAWPFHSVDASSWQFAPRALGGWEGYGKGRAYLRTRHKIGEHFDKDYWIEVLEQKRRAKVGAFRWRKQMEELR